MLQLLTVRVPLSVDANISESGASRHQIFCSNSTGKTLSSSHLPLRGLFCKTVVDVGFIFQDASWITLLVKESDRDTCVSLKKFGKKEDQVCLLFHSWVLQFRNPTTTSKCGVMWCESEELQGLPRSEKLALLPKHKLAANTTPENWHLTRTVTFCSRSMLLSKMVNNQRS